MQTFKEPPPPRRIYTWLAVIGQRIPRMCDKTKKRIDFVRPISYFSLSESEALDSAICREAKIGLIYIRRVDRRNLIIGRHPVIAILSWEIGWIDATSRRRLVCPTDVVFADPGFSFEEKLISARVLDRMKRSVSARVFLAEQPRNTGILVNDGEEDRYQMDYTFSK